MGVPIFANGGGISYIFQPTFGYILGFVAGTYITGTVAQKENPPSLKKIAICKLFRNDNSIYCRIDILLFNKELLSIKSN
jgi:biotin transporter BioY